MPLLIDPRTLSNACFRDRHRACSGRFDNAATYNVPCRCTCHKLKRRVIDALLEDPPSRLYRNGSVTRCYRFVCFDDDCHTRIYVDAPDQRAAETLARTRLWICPRQLNAWLCPRCAGKWVVDHPKSRPGNRSPAALTSKEMNDRTPPVPPRQKSLADFWAQRLAAGKERQNDLGELT